MWLIFLKAVMPESLAWASVLHLGRALLLHHDMVDSIT